MKTSELTGAMLDCWVAKAEGFSNARISYKPNASETLDDEKVCYAVGQTVYRPSTDWSRGGPIIERESMELMPVTKGRWVASACGRILTRLARHP